MKRASRAETWIARALVAAMLAVLACEEDPPTVTRMAQEGFETRCGADALPCNWEQVGGADGQARYGTGFHPGDHALVLEGSGVTVRGPGGETRAAVLMLGTLRAELGARCDPGNSLTLTIGIVDATTPGAPAFVDELTGTATPPLRWGDGGAAAALTARTALAEGGLGMRPGYTVRITSITITKTGAGSCEISDISIDDLRAFRSPDIGCSR